MLDIMRRKQGLRELQEMSEPEWVIKTYHFNEPGYLRFVLELREAGTSYRLNGMYRIHDPQAGPDDELVYFDSDGLQHESLNRNWNEIEKALSVTVLELQKRKSSAEMIKLSGAVSFGQKESIDQLFAGKLPEEHCDLSGVCFEKVRFKGSLENVDFSNCRFQFCLFQEADITGTTMRGAVFEYTDIWDCNIQNSDFRGVTMDGAHCYGTQILKCDFTNAKLENGYVDANSRFSGKCFEQAEIKAVNFENREATLQSDFKKVRAEKAAANTKKGSFKR